MSHIQYEERLAVYRDLTPAERAEVDAHLRTCPACAALLADYQRIYEALSGHPAPQPSVRLRTGWAAAVERARAQEQGRWPWARLARALGALGNTAAWTAVAAVAALLVLSLAVTWPQIVGRLRPATLPAGAAELAGSEWVLAALQGQPPLEGTQITLKLDQGKASGFAGCNRYGFEYTTPAKGTIAIGMMQVTAMGCREPAGVMEQEHAYTEALRSAVAYQLDGDRLEMQNSAGETVLSFQRRKPLAMDPAVLAGSAWQLALWDGRPPIEGAPITIAFTEHEVSGQAGCRGYTGAYEAEGDHIRFPKLSMTEVEPQCAPALQKQEGAYTTCLGWVSHYRLEGEQLTLLTERGETLVYARMQPPVTPTASPAVTVARLERLQDLCCPPVFAPDGKTYLTISSEGKLQVRTLSSGQAREVPISPTNGAKGGWPVFNAAWTPDGKSIVVSQGAAGPPAPLYLVDPASGAARPLGETYTPWRLSFDARGRLIVGTETAYQTLDLTSGVTEDLPGVTTRYTEGVDTELAFSPDGRYVAALEGSQLSIIDLSTGQKTAITSRIHPQWRAAMAWSEDGRRLAYATGEHGGAPELWVVGADGAGARQLLARQDERDHGGAIVGLAWLPGTPYIVYQFLPSGNTATLQAEYQVVSAAGGPARTLWTNDIGLKLSPDGHVVSFTRDLPGKEETGNWIAVLEYASDAPPVTPSPAAPLTREAAAVTPTPAPAPLPEKEMPPLLSLHMVDEETGWALASGALLHTTDGGRHWANVTPPGALGSAFSPAFVDGNRAWVASAFEQGPIVTLYRTTGGGQTWQTKEFAQAFSSAVMGLDLDAADLNSAWLLVEPIAGM